MQKKTFEEQEAYAWKCDEDGVAVEAAHSEARAANETTLIKYDAACRAIAAARTADEAKGIRDRAEAMRAYARQARNKQLEVDAAEIRIRAERRLGQILAAQKTLPREQGGD